MSESLLQTKLYLPPVRPGQIPRPHLIDRLNSALGKGSDFRRSLSLLSAPAGYGKTSLVSEWLQSLAQTKALDSVGQVDIRTAWISLEESDNDPARFFSYLIAALQRAAPDVGEGAQRLLGDTQFAVDALLITLLNDIAALGAPIVLVLDDYHLIRSEAIHHAVEFLIDHQPPHMHLALLTRHDPPLPLPRMRVRGQMTEIRRSNLQFSAREVALFFEHALGAALEDDLIASLDDRTEGWPAALQLVALLLQPKLPAERAEFIAAFRGSHRHLIDYLAQEVLSQQPDEVRAFLRCTAILERLSPSLCDALRFETGAAPAGETGSDVLLAQLERANLFLIPLDDQGRWYRYHPLFAASLRAELGEECRTALHLRAAQWHAAHELLPEAVHHALASGDEVLAEQMILQAFEGALRDAALTTLAGWLDALSEERVCSDAALATYKGVVLFLTDRRAEAARYAAAADQGLLQDGFSSLRGRLLCLQAHLALCSGESDRVVRLARHALTHLGSDDLFFRSLTLNALGQVLEMQGDVVGAVEAYREALEAHRGRERDASAVVVLTNLAIVLNEMGQRREALARCEAFSEAAVLPSGGLQPLQEAIGLVRGLLFYEASELDRAEEELLHALAICEQANMGAGTILGRYLLARVQLARGNWEAVKGLCREGKRLARQMILEELQGLWFAALEAKVWLQSGDLAAAAAWAEAAGLSPADAPHYWLEPVYFTYVQLLLAQDRLEEASHILATLEHSARQGGRERKRITILLQQSRVQQARGERHSAQRYLEQAVRLAAPQGYLQAFLDEGPEVAHLLSGLDVSALGASVAFVGRVLAAFDLHPVPAVHPEMIEPLTEREIEILRLIAAGRSNPEIATHLYLSLNTVKWHVKNLYGKLGVHNRAQAIVRAQDLALL